MELGAQEMQRHRAEQYGRLAAVLEKDREVPGAAAIFDQALSCGLAAIVAHQWPGEELKKNGAVKSARFLIEVAKARAEKCPGQADVQMVRLTSKSSARRCWKQSTTPRRSGMPEE
ncbi:hypothetical protein ACWIGX_18090 [Streptomyces nigrescens]